MVWGRSTGQDILLPPCPLSSEPARCFVRSVLLNRTFRWCNQHPFLTSTSPHALNGIGIVAAASSEMSLVDGSMVLRVGFTVFAMQCQDQFFFMHGALFGARQRLYDVPVAVDVLVNGQYSWLPKGIEYCGGDMDPRPIFEVCKKLACGYC